MSILVLAVYSTVLSALWLIVACVKPRYNWRISHASGAMAPDTASVLAAGLAKSIELSHVTVFVAFLGQVLSRRAISRGSQGITIADLTMRNWVMQPGTMITHWESLLSAGHTRLGIITLIVTVMAIFYTTASDALGMLQQYTNLVLQALHRHRLISSLNLLSFILPQCKKQWHLRLRSCRNTN